MDLMNYNEYLAIERKIYSMSDFSEDSDIIIEKKSDMFLQWVDLIGKPLKAGNVCSYEGVKYLVMQNVTPITNQPPNGEGMLAIYKPYRNDNIYEWLYGEYVEKGWIRTWEGISYKAIQDPNANIYPPNQAPAIWEESGT